MATPKPPAPTLQIVAVFSRYPEALAWVRQRVQQQWGAIALSSPTFDHSETSYYAAEMGSELRKQFLVVEGSYDPADLASSKLESNAWEKEFRDQANANYPEIRPVNIDPGYLTLTKLVLASAKDRAHRIYLRDGIYAEECLYYLKGWQSRPWTYPDYQRADFHAFFESAREYLKRSSGT
ncbi:MAG TPA: DUF4416 domain-containing protein [Planctomycetaceae bacterium]|nr:DUF4416 domain-containing protein [Planctomycetaceae bacterium]